MTYTVLYSSGEIEDFRISYENKLNADSGTKAIKQQVRYDKTHITDFLKALDDLGIKYEINYYDDEVKL